jgi:pimeloyl-ACP methyl ester carboxylesterase
MRWNPLARALAALLGFTVAGAAAPATGPAGDAFYQPPALGAGVHGDLIWSRPLTGTAALPSAARNLLVLYRTTAQSGNDVAVSGIVSVPQGTPPAGGWPVLSWAHGTTGDAPACAPSRDVPGGPMAFYLSQTDQLLDGFVAHGFAVLQTDYEGIGTPGVHPFLVGEAEARDVIDIVRAARQLEPDLGSRYVVIGHSQGGHAALFAAARAAAWAPELHFLGAAALAPASHLRFWLAALAHEQNPDVGFGFAALLVRGYASVDPALRPDRLWAPAMAALETQLETRCIAGLVQPDSWAGIVPERAFAPDADLAPLLAAAAQNDPGGLAIDVPVLLVQGTRDQIVVPRATDLLAGELCARHAVLSYDTVPDADHFGVLSQAATLHDWAAARFAGTPADSNCGQPPKAGS